MAKGEDTNGPAPGDDGSERLDAGLRAAFGAAGPATGKGAETPSVVEVLGFGENRVMLDTPPGEHTPLVNPISAEITEVERVVGRYQVVGEIAQGGVGVILKARDRDLGRDCAMKIIRSDLRNRPSVVQRFVEEAQVGAQLQHPGIVPVYELGLLADSRPYFTMKLVKGETLAALLMNRADPKEEPRRFLGIFERICQTMSYAHARDVVHRDLKPWNIMVGEYGDVKVMDWGFAKVRPPAGRGKLEDSVSQSQVSQSQISIIETIRSLTSSEQSLDGAVIGTPAYMPPEQAMGEIERLDERADIFALGSILTEILTGEPAYTGDRVDEILFKASRARLEDALERLDRCRADKRLVALAKHCMAPAKKARPRDASEVAKVVSDYLSSVEADAQRSLIAAAEQKERARGERRSRRLTIAISLAVTCAVVLAGGLFLLLDRSRRNSRLADNRRLASLLEDASSLRRDAELTPAGTVDRWSRPQAAADVAVRFAESATVDGTLRTQATDLLAAIREVADREKATIAAERATQVLAARIADIRTAGWESPGAPGDPSAYAAAFRDHDVDLDRLAPKDAASLLAASPIRPQILAALDDWSRDLRDRAPLPERENRPLQVLRELDRDPVRDRIRRINAGKSPRERRPELVAIARALRPADQTGATAALLGESLLVAGSPEAALVPLDRALAADPTAVRVHFARGWALLSLTPARPVEALRHFTAVIARRPGCRGARVGLLVALVAAGREEDAEELILELRQDAPEDQRIAAHRGIMQMRDGSTPVGLRTLAAAADAAPGDAWIRTVYAEALLSTGDRRSALRELNAARGVAPGYRPAHDAWIRALDLEQRLSVAVDHYRALAASDRRDAEARYHLGVAMILSGLAEEAIAALTEAVAEDPGEPDYRLALGRARYATGDHTGAAEEFALALENRAGFPAARRYRSASLCHRRETLDEGLAELRLIVDENPDDADAHADLALEWLRRLDLPAALDLSERAVELDARSPRTRLIRALALAVGGHFDKAHETFRMAVAGEPAEFRYLWLFSEFLRNTGRLQSEYNERKVQAGIRPRDAHLRTFVGLLDLQAGRPAAALREIDAALSVRPDLAAAHMIRGKALSRTGDDAGAVVAHRAARDARPDMPLTWSYLGNALLERGAFAEAYRCLSRAHALGSGDMLWNERSARDLREALNMLELSARYEQAVSGTVRADRPEVWLLLARLCRRKGNAELAYRYYLKAWREAGGQFPGETFEIVGPAAACAARLPEPDRIAAAETTLTWFKQGLQQLREHARRCPRGCTTRVLDRWLKDPVLAAYRDGLLLDQLPEAQAEPYREFWVRVRMVLAASRGRGGR